MSRIPAYLYHPDHEPKIFHSEEELEAALAAGWVDSPAMIQEDAPPASAPMGMDPDVWGDVSALMAYGRSIGMILGPNYKLETLQQKVAEFLDASADKDNG